MLYFDDKGYLLKYFKANPDRYEFHFDVNSFDLHYPNAYLLACLSSRLLKKVINHRLFNLCNYYEPCHNSLFSILKSNEYRATAYKIWDIGFGELLVQRLSVEWIPTGDDYVLKWAYFLAPTLNKRDNHDRCIPWKEWFPNNKIIPEGVTVI